MRNLHSRLNDHSGSPDIDDIAMDDGTPVRTFLTALLAGIPTRQAFTANATFKRTMAWQLIPGSIGLDAVIGTPSALTYPGFFTANAARKKTTSGSFTANAVLV